MNLTHAQNRYFVRLGLALILCLSLALGVFKGVSSSDTQENEDSKRDATVSLTTITYAQLPVQAQETYQLIMKGGPFKYRQDGVVFGNYEKLLPTQPQGYYREYTVRTPGINHRGARRIVCAGKIKTDPEKCYYTQDHYSSFRQIVELPLS